MKDKIPEITEIMKKLDKIRDECESRMMKEDIKRIVDELNTLRELMDY